jgi:HK97 gp10 family phage protein
MSDRIGFTFGGDREVMAQLQAIPPELRERAIPQALRFAGRAIVSKARTLVPRDTGLLRKSLGLVLRKPRRRKRGDSYIVIGARSGFGQEVTRRNRGHWSDGRSRYADPRFYSHLVEFGHYIVRRIKGTSRRKQTATELLYVLPRPFLRPAFAGSIATVRARLIQSLRTYMARRVKAALKRAARAA